MSWASTGFEEIDKADKYSDSGGERAAEVREMWTPVGATKRIIILDDQPFGFWQHSLWSLGVKKEKPICLDRNGGLAQTHGACPFCEQTALHKKTNGAEGNQLWPSYVGYITVIDCGEVKTGATGQFLEGWVNDKEIEYNYDRKLLPLKKGGRDKPGLLQKLRRLREKKQGSLVGCVFDLYRGGQKEERVGTEWEYICRVDVSTVEKLQESVRGLDGYRPDRHDALVKGVVTDNSAIDYMTHFEPENRAQLMRHIGAPAASYGAGSYGDGAAATSYGSDDVIPF